MKLTRTSNSNFVRLSDGTESYTAEYEVQAASARDIEDLAMEYGRTDDALRLYDDGGTLIAMAVWPQTGGGYRYCYGDGLSENPAWCIWRGPRNSSRQDHPELLRRYQWTLDSWGGQAPPQNAEEICKAANDLIAEFIADNSDATDEEVQDYAYALWERYCQRGEINGIKPTLE